jgi:hypothetical protein
MGPRLLQAGSRGAKTPLTSASAPSIAGSAKLGLTVRPEGSARDMETWWRGRGVIIVYMH